MPISKTSGLESFVISVTIVFLLSFVILSLGYLQFYFLSIQPKIQLGTSNRIITSIVFVVLLVAIHTYSTVEYFPQSIKASL